MIRNIETLSLKGSKNLATGRHALQHGCVLRQIYLPVSSTPLPPPPPGIFGQLVLGCRHCQTQSLGALNIHTKQKSWFYRLTQFILCHYCRIFPLGVGTKTFFFVFSLYFRKLTFFVFATLFAQNICLLNCSLILTSVQTLIKTSWMII